MATTLIILGIIVILWIGLLVGIIYLINKESREKLELLDKQLEREEQRINYINANHDFKYAEYGCVIDKEELLKMANKEMETDKEYEVKYKKIWNEINKNF